MARIDDVEFIVIDQRQKNEEQDRSLPLEIVWPNEAHDTKVCCKHIFIIRRKFNMKYQTFIINRLIARFSF